MSLRVVRRAALAGCLLVVVLALVPAQACGAPSPTIHHDLTIRLDPQSRALVGEDTLSLPGRDPVELRLDPRFAVESLALDGGARGITRRGPGRWQVEPGSGAAGRTLRIRYRGTLEPLARADHRGVLGALPPMADARGSYLPAGAGWHPEVRGRLFTYRLTLHLPAGQRGLVPGRLIQEREDAGDVMAAFALDQPVDDLALMAGPYHVKERRVALPSGADVRLRTYFHAEVAPLADGYLRDSAEYLALYSRWIGDYPFTEFSIVSSPLPTGFGMPTLTYLGIEVLGLPFIRRTSLGHEVLHNWWGNGVYVDHARGNWSEGLATFMADYTYAERETAEAARDMRLGWLRDAAAVPPGQDFPLTRFTARTHGTSQVVGYHKAAFVFLMLRDRIGWTAFDDGVRRFWREQRGQIAGWDDLRNAFEASSGQDLDRFFEQWLARSGAPQVELRAARPERAATGYRVHVTLAQSGPPYVLDVPVVVTTDRGPEPHSLRLAASEQTLGIDVPARPTAVSLDPEFRLFRRLGPSEAPPILRQVILDPATVTIPVSSDPGVTAAATQLAGRLLDHGVRAAPADGALPDAPLLVIGTAAEVDAFLARHGLPARPEAVAGPGTAQAWTARQPSGKALAVVSADTAEGLRHLVGPLPHYGRQSYLVFDGPKVRVRGTWPSRSPALTLPDAG
jgi:hypothetical protein